MRQNRISRWKLMVCSKSALLVLAVAGIGLAATYGFYALSAFVSIFFVLKFVHETRGRELEQMEG